MEIAFDPQIKNAAPGLEVVIIEADINNGPTSDELWQLIEQTTAQIAATYPMESVRHRPAIDAARNVYKALGKDPNRYRPSAEALCRRAVKGLELYRTLAMIDLINLVSLRTGHSIGGFDAGHICGNLLTLGVGRDGEPYEAIGRGELNIAGLPVFRDAIGGIGTPTSDNVRTALSESTRRVLLTVNYYGTCEDGNKTATDMLADLMRHFVAASNMNITSHRP